MKTRFSFFRRCFGPVVIGVTAWLMFRYILFIGYVPTASMEPTIPAGTFILGSRMYGDLDRGDIIIFQKDGSALVKRIFALGGDAIYVSQDHEVSLDSQSFAPASTLVVPDGCVFVLGDNPQASHDSRQWEDPFLPLDSVCAKLILF